MSIFIRFVTSYRIHLFGEQDYLVISFFQRCFLCDVLLKKKRMLQLAQRDLKQLFFIHLFFSTLLLIGADKTRGNDRWSNCRFFRETTIKVVFSQKKCIVCSPIVTSHMYFIIIKTCSSQVVNLYWKYRKEVNFFTSEENCLVFYY